MIWTDLLFPINSAVKSIDLVTITPADWTQKAIDLTSPTYMPPEVHSAFDIYQAIDTDRRECVINSRLGPDEDLDTVVAICLWNTLTARFVEEVGNPVTSEAVELMRKSVFDKRKEVLEALGTKNDLDPQEIVQRRYKD